MCQWILFCELLINAQPLKQIQASCETKGLEGDVAGCSRREGWKSAARVDVLTVDMWSVNCANNDKSRFSTEITLKNLSQEPPHPHTHTHTVLKVFQTRMWLFKTKICGLFIKTATYLKMWHRFRRRVSSTRSAGAVLMYPPRASSPRLDVLTFAADSYVPVVVKHEI